MNRVFYRKGYKYQLARNHTEHLGDYESELVGHMASQGKFIVLGANGHLLLRAGYAWDGCSGPTRDDRTNTRAGLVHDALCQLFRWQKLPRRLLPAANRVFPAMLKEDGMGAFRRWYYYQGITIPEQTWTQPEGRRPIFYAP